jgi:hypothetical protein
MSGLQLKTGKTACNMKPGVLDTQRGYRTPEIEDNTVAGILVKTERGFAKLLPALHTCFPDIDWFIGSIITFTTKSAASAAGMFAISYPAEAEMFHIWEAPEGKSMRDSGAVAAIAPVACSMRDRGAVAAIEPLAFSWEIVKGIQRVKDLLPAAVAAML